MSLYRSLAIVIVLLVTVVCSLLCGINGQTLPYTFDRIMVIIFENQPNFFTMRHSYFKELALKKGSHLTGYHGVTHPSQPNYVSMIAGDHFEKTNDKLNYNVTMLADLMERKGLNWKSYQENYPSTGSCYVDGSFEKLYYRKHNPFMSFISVTQNEERCVKHVVNSEQLYVDIANNNLPQLLFYTPNMNNGGHDTSLKYANQYLSEFLPPLLENRQFMNGTLIVVTFDEDNYLFNNAVYCALLGPMVQAGKKDSTKYNHYSLLRTIEDNFELGTLGRHDSTAKSFKNLLRENKYKDFNP